MIEILFNALLGIMIYTYFAYPALLGFFSFFKRKQLIHDKNAEPLVSIIIAAYNEEKVIKDRLQNIFSSDYPKEKIEVIVASDGSTDRTAEIANAFVGGRVKVFKFNTKRGRAAVQDDTVKHATSGILFFTDAETKYDTYCIRNMVKHYADEKVGCVCGRLIAKNLDDSALGLGQKLYWRFEYFLRTSQSKLGILSKATGANMSIRKSLYKNVQPEADIDTVAPLNVVLAGYRVVYEEDAVAYETFSLDFSRQFLIRQRYVLYSFWTFKYYFNLLNPFAHPVVAVNLISYKLLRYLTPVFLIALFFLNLALVGKSTFYNSCFILQSLFYLFALAGFMLMKTDYKTKIFSVPFSICYLELGILSGVIKFLQGKKIVEHTKES